MTKELVIELYKKSIMYFTRKYNKEPDNIHINEDGDITAEYCNNYDVSDYKYAKLEDIFA